MTDAIKRGDAATLVWELDPLPPDATAAKVIIRPAFGGAAVVSRGATLDVEAGRVSITLTPAETATAGLYRCEVEISPGPVTYPSDGYEPLTIRADLG